MKHSILHAIADKVGGSLGDLYEDQDPANENDALLTYQDEFSSDKDEDKTTFHVDLRRLGNTWIAVDGVIMLPDAELISKRLLEKCTS